MNTEFTCNLCGAHQYKIIPFRYLFKGRHINAVRCTSCGLISLFPIPTDDEITEMYAEAYFTESDVQTHHYKKDYLSAVEHLDFTKQLASISHNAPKGGSILEVGCATGELLSRLRTEGYKVTGVEISAFAAERAMEKHGLQVFNASFNQESLASIIEESSFDLILMGDVLEHFKNPAEAMRFAFALLKPGGKLMVHVPSTLNLISSRFAFIMYRIVGSQKTMTIPPYHLTEFFPRSLRKLFQATGFSSCNIIQETKHPKTITLRHSLIENLIKVLTQYPNYWLTRLTGLYGDRITGIGTK